VGSGWWLAVKPEPILVVSFREMVLFECLQTAFGLGPDETSQIAVFRPATRGLTVLQVPDGRREADEFALGHLCFGQAAAGDRQSASYAAIRGAITDLLHAEEALEEEGDPLQRARMDRVGTGIHGYLLVVGKGTCGVKIPEASG